MIKNYGVLFGGLILSLSCFAQPKSTKVLACQDSTGTVLVEINKLDQTGDLLMKITDKEEIAVEQIIAADGGPVAYVATVGVPGKRANLTTYPTYTPSPSGKIKAELGYFEKVGTGAGGNSQASVRKTAEVECD